MAEEIIAILQRMLARGDTKEAVAARLGRTRTWLYGVLNGETPGPEVCIRLARLEGLSVLDVLRAGGHEELAGELVAIGFEADGLVSQDDRDLLAALKECDADQRRNFRELIRSVAAQRRPVPPARGDTARRRKR